MEPTPSIKNDNPSRRNEKNDVASSAQHHRALQGSDFTVVSAISDDRTCARLAEVNQTYRFEKSLPLCGRSKEQDELLAAFETVTASTAVATKTVIIRGPSGCGKSALVEKTFESVFEERTTTKGWFVKGKFDQYNGRNDPFSAIITAITTLIDLIEHFRVAHLYESNVREAIKGNENAFALIFPNLCSITNMQYEITSLKPLHPMIFRRFISTFRALLSALSCQEYPLVLFLDDMQWIDDATLELLQALIDPKDNSPSIRNVLLIGAIRSEDPWAETILNRLNHGAGTKFIGSESIIYIGVDAVDQNTVTQIVSASLGQPSRNCSSLGSVVYHKTGGSPLAVLRFLDLVASKGLLAYENSSWMWDESKIMSETNVSTNVLELVQQNMERLPKPLTDLLTIAAFLGYEFKSDTLIGLVRCESSETFACRNMTECELMALLSRACGEGYVEATAKHRNRISSLQSYKFCHDKIQQAFYVSFADSDSQMLHRAIGLYLWNEDKEMAAIEVADHFNRAGPCFISKAMLLDVNYAAAKIARSKKAYRLSAMYVRRALHQLGTDKWATQYDRSLAMSTFLLELCIACGDDAEIDLVVGEVSEHGRCLEDKLPILYSKVCFLGSSCRYWEAIKCSISVIRLCGKTVPRNPNLLQIVLLLSAVRRRASKLTDDDIVELPKVEEKKAEYLMKLYARIATYAMMMNLASLPIFCAFRASKLSFSQGVSAATPVALAVLGIAEVACGNFSAAARYGRLVTRLVEERDMGPETTAQACAVVASSVIHWSTELTDRELKNVLKIGMDVGVLGGELEFGYFSATLNFCLERCCGVPLLIVEHHARESCLKMKEFKVEGILSLAKVVWQAILNLLGQSECPTVLSGEAMNESDHMNDTTIKESSTQQLAFTYQKFLQARIFSSYDLAKQLARKLNECYKDYPLKTSFSVYEIKLNLALVWYHFARQSSSRRTKLRYLSKARREVKYMKSLKRNGCPNFDSALYILEAEDATCVEGQTLRHVKGLYDVALSHLSGKLHYEAIVLEQAAMYLIGRQDLVTGANYMQRAVSKYLEWNAYAKATDLVSKFSHLAGYLLPEEDSVRNMTLCVPSTTAGSDHYSGE